MRSALRSVGISIATIAVLAACGPHPPATRDLLVKLDWDVAGVPISDGQGTFTTDLGYTVEADRFEVTAYSFEIIPCEQPPPQPPQAPGAPRQSSLSFIGTAWAGHRVGHPVTLTSVSRIESPMVTRELDFDRLHIPDVAYCAGHYLIGRLPEETAIASDAASIGVSLRLHGRYRKGADGAWTDFAVETTVAHGVLVDFKPEGSGKGIRLKNGDILLVSRRLDTTFNGVDFATMDPPALARQVLRQIVAGTTLAHQSGQQS